jgi:hypothetical protein
MNIIFPAWRTRTASVGLERHIDTNVDAARLGCVRHITFRISDADN